MGLTWIPGTEIGAFTLLREIARGGMGEIWLAHHRGPAGFERLVVIKRIIANGDEDKAFVDMFLDEARIASQLLHPNVVQVYELGQDEGSYYLVMEYLPGQPLGRIARKCIELYKTVPPLFAVEVVAGAARGLGYAHRRKGLDGVPLRIVHRDVSPQNILVTYEGSTKVLDFGIAKAEGRLARTSTGIVKGKIAYMSPEQAIGLPVDASADVFALGVILFELVTGTRLYQGADDLSILKGLANHARLPRASERARVDPKLDELISKAMEWESINRFSDGQVLCEALEAWQRAQSASARSETVRDVMQATFGAEIEQLPELQKVNVRTPSPSSPTQPSPGSAPSLPNGIATPPRQVHASVLVGVGLLGGALVAGAAYWLLRTAPVSTVEALPKPAPMVEVPLTVTKDLKGAQEPEAPSVVIDAGSAVTAVTVDAGAPSRPNQVARRGALTLDTDPWTKVFVGKRLLGETPLIEVSLPAGRQQLRLVNEAEKIDTVIEVEVLATGVTVKKLAL